MLPLWLQQINSEVYTTFSEHQFFNLIHQGDSRALQEFVKLYWPVVDAFPSTINSGCRVIIRALGRDNKTFRELATIFHKTPVDLIREYSGDESNHREYWVSMAESLGLDLTLNDWAIPEIKEITTLCKTRDDLSKLCYYLIAVEISAEQISKYFLTSPSIKNLLPGQSINWFTVHNTDDDHLHTLIALSFAQELAQRSGQGIDETTAKEYIFQIIDRFVLAGHLRHQELMVRV